MAYWGSLAPYWEAVRRAWLALFFSGVLGVIGGVGLIWRLDVKLPLWLWFVLAVLCLSVAQFLAFHQMRLERDAAETAKQTAERRPRQAGIVMEGPGVHSNVFGETHITFQGPESPREPKD